jgi:hypothetical protein
MDARAGAQRLGLAAGRRRSTASGNVSRCAQNLHDLHGRSRIRKKIPPIGHSKTPLARCDGSQRMRRSRLLSTKDLYFGVPIPTEQKSRSSEPSRPRQTFTLQQDEPELCRDSSLFSSTVSLNTSSSTEFVGQPGSTEKIARSFEAAMQMMVKTQMVLEF